MNPTIYACAEAITQCENNNISVSYQGYNNVFNHYTTLALQIN